MAIDLKSKREKKKIPKKDKFLLFLSFLFFCAIFAGYFLIIDYAETVEEEERKTLSVYRKKEAEVSDMKNWENIFITDYKKINFIENLIYTRKLSENFFNLLETITHPYVYFKNLSLVTENREAHLKGSAYNFISFGQQVQLMRERAKITKGTIPNTLTITTSGDNFHGYIINFNYKDELTITIISPDQEKLSITTDNIEEGLLELTEVIFDVTFLKDFNFEEISNKSVYLNSRNLINDVRIVEASIKDEAIDERAIEVITEKSEDEEESCEEEENCEEEEFYFWGEVDFYIIVTVDPTLLETRND